MAGREMITIEELMVATSWDRVCRILGAWTFR
jgi:hypothetical protein